MARCSSVFIFALVFGFILSGEFLDVITDGFGFFIAAFDGGIGGPIDSRMVHAGCAIKVVLDERGINEGIHAELHAVAVVTAATKHFFVRPEVGRVIVANVVASIVGLDAGHVAGGAGGSSLALTSIPDSIVL